MSVLPACFDIVPGYRPGIHIDLNNIPWKQPSIFFRGIERKVPRLTCWYGEASYSYSGIVNRPLPMPTWLNELRMELSAFTSSEFNSVLLNYYRDGRDSVSWHSDNEKELGVDPVIASLSIGAKRRFSIKEANGSLKWDFDLSDGDLVVMRRESQRNYVHCVPKTTVPVDVRVNATFRWCSP